MNPPNDANDLKSGLEAGAVNTLATLLITTGTRETYPQNFQQIRPRVDVKAKIGAGTGRRDIRPSDGVLVMNGWRFDLACNVVTNLQHDGVEFTHTQLCFEVRKLMQELAQLSWSNLALFPFHNIAECLRENGTQNTLDQQGNFEYTAMNFSGIVIIRPGTQY